MDCDVIGRRDLLKQAAAGLALVPFLPLLSACGGTAAPSVAPPASSPAAAAKPSSAAAAASPGTSAATAASGKPAANGKQLLEELVAKAKQEGSLSASVRQGLGAIAPAIGAGFNKRFGLNLDVKLDDRVTEYELFAKTRAAVQAGAPPPVDALEGPDGSHLPMALGGLAQRVDNWQALLAEINPVVASGQLKAEQLSPDPLQGFSFIWSHVAYVGIYNPKLISKADLPKRRADLADAKYKGKVASSPWLLDPWAYGPLVYAKDELVKAAQGLAKNAASVALFPDSANRILLGELAFAELNHGYYYQSKAKDQQAPIEIHYFEDFTPMGSVLNMIPKGSKHPAAATLFSLWMTTPEAEAIWSTSGQFYLNVLLNTQDVSKQVVKNLKDAGSTMFTWFDNPKTVELFRWQSTDEGKAYLDSLSKALTQRG
ncbi:MAG TPA: extracellular solute-binding protein [Chloroflexota bacterium]|nr:extracellular solute-binding protein [Chloroflexota bacterium]